MIYTASLMRYYYEAYIMKYIENSESFANHSARLWVLVQTIPKLLKSEVPLILHSLHSLSKQSQQIALINVGTCGEQVRLRYGNSLPWDSCSCYAPRTMPYYPLHTIPSTSPKEAKSYSDLLWPSGNPLWQKFLIKVLQSELENFQKKAISGERLCFKLGTR